MKNSARSIKLSELCKAIKRLSPDDLARFRAWFQKFDASRWDEEFEADVLSGRMDKFAGDLSDKTRTRLFRSALRAVNKRHAKSLKKLAK